MSAAPKSHKSVRHRCSNSTLLVSDLDTFEQAVIWKRLYFQYAGETLGTVSPRAFGFVGALWGNNMGMLAGSGAATRWPISQAFEECDA